MRSRQVLAGMLLAALGVAFALGVVEMGVRLLHLVPARFWEPDAVLGSRLIPGKGGWWTQEEHEFRVQSRINPDGWRDIQRPRAKPPGTFRVLVLGDSFIEALQVPLENTFGRLLEAELEGPTAPIEVLSMGVSGYGTAGELLLYRERGRSYAPDLVLLAFYPGNDVRNNSPVLEPVLRPVYDENGQLERVSGKQRRSPTRPGLLGRSAAYQYLRKRLITGHPELAERLVAFGLLGRGALSTAPTAGGVPVDYLVYSAETLPDWEDAWQRTFGLLDSLRVAVEAAGARFAIMVVTAREQIYPAEWRQVLAANPAMASMRWDLEAPEGRIGRWCGEVEVPCFRLSPVFEKAATNGPRLHFLHDGHWTEAGHALAARTVAAFLQTEGLVPKTEKEREE